MASGRLRPRGSVCTMTRMECGVEMTPASEDAAGRSSPMGRISRERASSQAVTRLFSLARFS